MTRFIKLSKRKIMKNSLFNNLVNWGVFKYHAPSPKSSDKTRERARDRKRGSLVWLSKEYHNSPLFGMITRGNGTYIRKKHGKLPNR